MRFLAPILAALLLPACQPAVQPAGSNPPIAATAIAGEYRLASVGDAPVDLPEPMRAAITATRIDLQSGCIRLAFDYRLEGGRLATTAAPVPSCRRALLPAEQTVQDVLRGGANVARLADGSLAITGTATGFTLVPG
jgi:hypothetical protein